MDAAKPHSINQNRSFRLAFAGHEMPLAAGILFLLTIGGILTWWVFGDSRQNSGNMLFLLPWVGMTAVVIFAPLGYLFYRGQFNLFHPLFYAAWSYFVPAFVLGGIILAFGWAQQPYLYFIEDPQTDIPLTFIYISLGFAGLSAGFMLPFGKYFGGWLSRKLPVWNWKPSALLMPGVFLLLLGTINTTLGFMAGILGYQRAEEYGTFDGSVYLLSLLLMEGTFLLWFVIFRTPRLNINHYIVIGLLIFTTLLRAAFAGNRSNLLMSLISIIAAFVLAGRRIGLRQGIFGGVAVITVIVVGMIYGTTFRSLKQDESRIEFSKYAELVPQTFDAISRQDIGAVLGQGFSSLAERFENVSSVAVVVSNYEKLKPYEESYGLNDNIWKDTITFVIPRPLWPDKPVASEPHKYGELYFNYGENSFTITPMGDLLRNFGPVGVPLGMMLLGFILRVFYATLIENQIITAWRATMYFMLLFTVSYESFYGSIIPYLVRVGIVSVVGILIIWFLIPRIESGRLTNLRV